MAYPHFGSEFNFQWCAKIKFKNILCHGNILAIYLVGGQVDRASDFWFTLIRTLKNNQEKV